MMTPPLFIPEFLLNVQLLILKFKETIDEITAPSWKALFYMNMEEINIIFED